MTTTRKTRKPPAPAPLALAIFHGRKHADALVQEVKDLGERTKGTVWRVTQNRETVLEYLRRAWKHAEMSRYWLACAHDLTKKSKDE